MAIRGWSEKPTEHFTTKIFTESARADYAAIKAMINTTLYIGQPEFYNTVQWPVALKILNAYDYDADNYFGVVLESRSLLVGSQFISFTDPAVNDGKSTVLSSNRISVSGDSTYAK